MASASPGPAIGIDLGTTFSCVAVLTDVKVEVIVNRNGKRTMPSYVTFTENERWIGERAKTRALMEPENTVNNVKRLIGRTITDENVKKDIQSFPFKVINDGKGNPTIQVKFEGKDRLFRPEEISAMVLGELKTLAEEFLGKPVKDAVITVPAYFTDSQRQATKSAGIIAGLNVLGTINEPTAAALAYGFDTSEKLEKNTVMVYDFGGGTFDVSVLDIVNGKVDVLSSGGDGHLGGEDIDEVLVRHMNSEFLKKHDIDLFQRASSSSASEARNAKKALRRLRFACEKLKIDLSNNRHSIIDLDLLFDEKNLYAKVSREFFEGLCEDLFRKTITTVLETLGAANLSSEDISEIILVGGSTRIPMVTKMLKEVFPSQDFCENINADEAVAYGAAIQAAILSGMDPLQVKNVRFRDVTPMSLGIETFGGVMSTVIKRNTTVPVQKTKVFTTSRDNQTQICIKVFEGQRHITKYNNFLGEFTLVGIPPAPRRIPQVEVIFEVDANGILRVKATDLGTEWVSDIQVTNSRGRLSPEEIERAVREAERMRDQDMKERLKVRARVRLEVYATQIQKALTNPVIRDKLDPEKSRKLSAIVDEALKLYESYQNPGEAEFEKKYNELDKLWLSEVIKCYPAGYNHGSPDAPSVSSENLLSLSTAGFEMVDDFSTEDIILNNSLKT